MNYIYKYINYLYKYIKYIDYNYIQIMILNMQINIYCVINIY